MTLTNKNRGLVDGDLEWLRARLLRLRDYEPMSPVDGSWRADHWARIDRILQALSATQEEDGRGEDDWELRCAGVEKALSQLARAARRVIDAKEAWRSPDRGSHPNLVLEEAEAWIALQACFDPAAVIAPDAPPEREAVERLRGLIAWEIAKVRPNFNAVVHADEWAAADRVLSIASLGGVQDRSSGSVASGLTPLVASRVPEPGPATPSGNLIERLRERAESYRQSGPSAEHTAALLDNAAAHISATHGEYDRLRARHNEADTALRRLISNKDSFDQSSGNQADAYYCLVKGCDADWRAARRAVGEPEDGLQAPQSDGSS